MITMSVKIKNTGRGSKKKETEVRPADLHKHSEMTVEDNNWSSIDDVLDSFNNVSIMPNSRRNNDIFSNPPSPPKHRISPSQIELLGGSEEYREQNGHTFQSSMGRGRYIKDIMERISPQGVYKAMENDIRSIFCDQSNAVIENLYKSKSFTSYDQDGEADSAKESEGSSEVFSADNDLCDPDQMSVNSNLNVNADPFYPSILNSSDKLNTSPTTSMNPNIRFPHRKIYETESEDDEKESEVNRISPSNQISNPILDDKPVVDVSEKTLDIKKEKKPRGKRIMKNALLSSLTSKQRVPESTNLSKPTPLLRPSDFTCSLPSEIPSSTSTLRPSLSTSCEARKHSDILPKPNGPMADPLVNHKTKETINSLTLSPSSSQHFSNNTPLARTFRSLTKLKSSPPPKSLSHYEYNYNENDFPPL